MTEKQIENNILCFLAEIGIKARKVQSTGIYDARFGGFRKNRNPYNAVGMSDIIGLLPSGRFLAIEVKTHKGRPTENQLRYIEEIQKSNGIAFISRSVTQTYAQLQLFMPELKKFNHIVEKWAKIEHKLNQ